MIEGSCHCGAVHWRFDAVPASATACSCTVCRRYGTLWAYDYEDEGIHLSGPTQAYVRGEDIEFHFCPACACVTWWRGRHAEADGRRRVAVNLRLADPEQVAAVPIRHFDGLTTFEDLPMDGRCVRDYWF
ncbi:MAG TPA: GFA family protein [Pseudomonadales bacterium]|nr:GFA family protein [Pseudomonadales bacterium]